MAMDATQMALERIAAVAAVNGDFDAGAQAEISNELIADCQAIIDHIINNAVIGPGTFANGAGAVTGTGVVQS